MGQRRHETTEPRQVQAVDANGSKPNAITTSGPRRRLRRPRLLPEPGDARVPYAKSHPDLQGITDAQVARMVLDSDAWQQVMKPVLDLIDRARIVPGKEKPLYTSEELESVLLYQRICGYSSYKRARNAIAGDREEARRLLGFDRPRNRGRRVVKLRDGVPSEATVSRHRARLGEHRRKDLYEEVEAQLLAEHLEFDALKEEARELNVDGTSVNTHYTGPIIDPTDGRVVNDRRITAPDAGYVPWTAGPDKSGHGWCALNLVTATGIPLVRIVAPINTPEPDLALQALERFRERVLPHVANDGLTVLSGDGAFSAPDLRAAVRKLGIVENIHHASHGDSPATRKNVATRDAERIPITGYKDWFANGHRELKCACGQGTTFRRFARDRQGHVVTRVEGTCENCGSITITSGDWRRARNPRRWVRIDPRNQNEKPDYSMGNPLTYHDPVSREYGRRRFGHNEGFHGALQTRFGLIKDKRWFRRQVQVETEFAIAGCVMHVVAMHQRRQAAATAAAAGPPTAKAPPALAA